ncbi:MAG: amidohydrolase family protein [Pseudomonadota bacterium]
MAIDRRDFLASLAVAGGSATLAGCAGPATQTGNGDYRNIRVIDAHAHWYPQEFVTLLEKEGPANGARMGRDSQGNPVVLSVLGGTQTSVMRRNMTDLNAIIREMDARKVNTYALSMTNPMVYWAPPAFALKLSQAANDAGSAAHLQYPDRFVGTIMLPMQDTKLAVQELERAAKLPGMRAIGIGEHINGKNLHEKQFWPVYERAEALGLPLFTHNLYPTDGERLKDFYMINTLGNLSEDGIAAVSLICGGVMDAFPKLEVYLPHAGGTFPFMIGRLDYAIGKNPALNHMTRPARRYLKRFYYDIITLDPQVMKMVIDLVGVDRVMMGTDYPQIMGVNNPIEFVDSVPGLSRQERERILGSNAARLLKIG